MTGENLAMAPHRSSHRRRTPREYHRIHPFEVGFFVPQDTASCPMIFLQA